MLSFKRGSSGAIIKEASSRPWHGGCRMLQRMGDTRADLHNRKTQASEWMVQANKPPAVSKIRGKEDEAKKLR